jgi:hypothetical protein
MTPGWWCSVVIGEGLPLVSPVRRKGFTARLVVEDIDVAREELASHGVAIRDVQQLGPQGAPGSRFAFFNDPDENGWSLEEIKRG